MKPQHGDLVRVVQKGVYDEDDFGRTALLVDGSRRTIPQDAEITVLHRAEYPHPKGTVALFHDAAWLCLRRDEWFTPDQPEPWSFSTLCDAYGEPTILHRPGGGVCDWNRSDRNGYLHYCLLPKGHSEDHSFAVEAVDA